MPYEIIWEPRGVLIRLSGPITAQEILISNDKIYADPRFDTHMDYQIADMLRVTSVNATGDEIREIARRDAIMSRRRPHVAVALVTDRDVIYGFSRMYQICTDRSMWETQIFQTEAEARAWLGQRDANRSATRPA